MFALTVGNGHHTSRSIHATNRVVQQYLASLRSTDLDDVPVLELMRTLFADIPSTSTATLYKIIDIGDFTTGLYRDAAGTLVIRHHDAAGPLLSLLWPVVGRPGSVPSVARGETSILGNDGNVFLVDEASGDLVPLPAATADRCGYGWGSPSTEVINLYLAIVHAVSGVRAPVPRPQFRDHPDSLYGWLLRKDRRRELRLSHADLTRMVRADEPLRLAARKAANRPTTQRMTPPPRFATARGSTGR